MKVIEFSKSRFLRFGPLPHAGHETDSIQKPLLEARKSGPARTIIFHGGQNGFPDPSVSFLLDQLNREGFDSTGFGSDLLHGPTERLAGALLDLLSWLKDGGVLFLYDPDLENQAREFLTLSLILLTGQVERAAHLWERVCGEDHPVPGSLLDRIQFPPFTKGNPKPETHGDTEIGDQSEPSPEGDLSEPVLPPVPPELESPPVAPVADSQPIPAVEEPEPGPQEDLDDLEIPAETIDEIPEEIQPEGTDLEPVREQETIAPRSTDPIPTGGGNQENGIKLSWLTIRVKLASVIPLIIAGALVTMTAVASTIFISHTRTLIQEYNLSLARITGKQIEKELEDYAYRTRVFFDSQAQKSLLPTGDGPRRFFAENPTILYIRSSSSGKTTEEYFNDRALRLLELDRPITRQGLDRFQGTHTMTTTGQVVIKNASPFFGIPLLALNLPAASNGMGDGSIFVLLHSAELLQSFVDLSQSGIFQVMLVNEDGTILAHSNGELSLAAASVKDWAIVRNMLESPIGNGSTNFDSSGISYLGSYQTLKPGGPGIVSYVEVNRVFEAVYSIQRQNILISAILIVLAFLAVFFFSRTITNPIVRLVGATRRIERGNYHVDIVPTSRDEIGVLTESFRHMAKGLDERERIKDTFGKFVNQTIVERALKGEIRLGGEKKTAAVFFSDLRNFTGISESMDPQKVVEMLNTYFTAMVEAVYELDGVVDKFIGDALMAHWGALTDSENNTAHAVEAALRMRTALIKINNDPSIHIPHLRFGAGINTGPVIAGQIGSHQKLEFTVIGDTVNLASRIEYLNKHFGTDILISSYSYERVKDLFVFEELPPINIKGKSKPETVYAVLGRKGDPDCPASIKALRPYLGIEFDEEEVRKQMAATSSDIIAGNSKKGE